MDVSNSYMSLYQEVPQVSNADLGQAGALCNTVSRCGMFIP
jgi:hypothetical protein